MAKSQEVLKRRALRLTQSAAHEVFLLSLSPADLLAICNLSAGEDHSLAEVLGAERESVRRHLAAIRSSTESPDGLMLTPVVLALSRETRFRGSRGPEVSDGFGFAGTIEIPMRTRGGRKPAWVLDGYFRLLAFSETENSHFAVPVCVLIADDPSVLRDQFARIHNTHPLPAGLADKLFPGDAPGIPLTIGARELPEEICEWLNNDTSSPFHQLIEPKGASGRARAGFPVSRRGLVEAIAESLSNPNGCLFPYRNMATGETDTDGLCNALATYWAAVKSVFPEAWGKPAKESRLMHPAGLRIMARLMNRVLPVLDLSSRDRVAQAVRELKKIKPLCRWTEGVWEELDGLRWDQLGENRRDINLASNFLVRAYLMK